MYDRLRDLQRHHDAWLERLLTTARPALDAALADAFRTRPELLSITWDLTLPLAVRHVEFHRRDGLTYHADDSTVTGEGDPTTVKARRYQPLGDLLLANAEILHAAVLTCPAHIVATRDGAVTVTPLDP